jgi:acyl dehydratase
MSDLSTDAPARGIREEALAKLRGQLGVDSPLRQYNKYADEDVIAHYAMGSGDDNPRWLDSEYAARTRWGGIIAPSTFVLTCGFPRSRGLAGVHALFTGVDIHCHKPIREGARVIARTALYALEEKIGDFAGREFRQTYETKYRDDAGELLSTCYSHAFRTERKGVKKGGKYADIAPQTYTDDDLAKIEAEYALELVNRRGATPRYIEDVAVQDKVAGVLKGPLTVTDCICFVSGFGWVFARPHRLWNDYRKQHPGVGIKNRQGVWDVPERVHWEEDLARAIGMPMIYDYGPQRIAWFDHAVSDWMGDDGWIRRIEVKLLAPNFMGDTTRIHGTVSAVIASDNCAVIDLKGEDQRGRLTAVGKAEVVLPSKRDAARRGD